MAAPFPAAVEDAKALICDLCASLYKMGWVGGTGGGISIKPTPEHIVMAPSGVQKERMQPDDMFVLDAAGTVLHTPAAKPPPARPPKLSECSPLFMALRPSAVPCPATTPAVGVAISATTATAAASATALPAALAELVSPAGCEQAYELRGAGAVIHGHSVNALLATLLDPDATEFKVTHIEMIKGIEGHGFYGNCVVPIIENTARECELTDRLRQAIAEYPQSQAVLVRRHGVYVWGKDWIQAKTQAECYDYLFQAAVEMRKLGMDASKPPAPPPLPAPAALPTSNGHAHDGSTPAPKKARMAPHGAATRSLPTAVVLDIEGTVAPISFVKEVMFPYAQAHTRAFLEASYESSETQEDIQLIRQQAATDAAESSAAGQTIPEPAQGQEAVIKAVVAWVEAAIGADRKVGALKQLQGHVWRSGFQQGKVSAKRWLIQCGLGREQHVLKPGAVKLSAAMNLMRAELYRDVPDALVEWRSLGLKTYIYSSGSREAQRMFFAHSQAGDMRPYLSGFFDTTSGAKTLPASYKDIALSLGVDSPVEIVFATDLLAEAQAASAAGRASSSSAWSKDHIAVQEPRRGPELGDVQVYVLLTLSSAPPGDPASATGQACQTSAPACAAAVAAAAVEVCGAQLLPQRVGPGILIINAGTAIATGGTGTGGAGGRGGFGRRGLLGNGGAGGAGIGGSSSVVGSGTSIGGQVYVLLTPSSAPPGDPASATGLACQTSAPACAVAVAAAAVEVCGAQLLPQRVGPGILIINAGTAIATGGTGTGGAGGRGGFGRRGLLGNGGAGGAGIGGSSSVVGSGTSIGGQVYVLLTPSSAPPGDPASATGQACQTSAPACAVAVAAAAVEVCGAQLLPQRVGPGILIINAGTAIATGGTGTGGAGGRGGFGRRGLLGNGGAGGAGIGGSSSVVGSGTSIGGQGIGGAGGNGGVDVNTAIKAALRG
ncbi:hypothetical protein QJQ45_018986 [Haematococcus lacustris]|nr:hypothetical protein QJQ45_018986 [Haematococcus lacustris]